MYIQTKSIAQMKRDKKLHKTVIEKRNLFIEVALF